MLYFLAEGVRHAARNFKGLDVFAKALSRFLSTPIGRIGAKPKKVARWACSGFRKRLACGNRVDGSLSLFSKVFGRLLVARGRALKKDPPLE
jgi:hypothetical protein